MADLAALENAFAFTLCDDYREFLALLGDRGYLEPDSLIAWPGVTKAGPGSGESPEEETPAYWANDIASLHGYATLRSELEQAREHGDHLSGWHLDLLELAYPIAVGYGGDTVIQVATGSSAGAIYHLYHDEWEPDDVEDLAAAGPGLVDELAGNWVADDFKSLYQMLVAIRGAA